LERARDDSRERGIERGLPPAGVATYIGNLGGYDNPTDSPNKLIGV